MPKETELKLRASPETLAALREHPLLKKRNKSGWQTRELLNQYFDTPERALAEARVALRLRRDGDTVIQTLKCRGTSVAGLSERNEHEWQLDKVKLDLKKLDDSCWPAQLADLDKKTIKPLFTTDFTREYAEIAWGRGKAKVVIEAALDQGFVIAGKRKEAICELELELREGEPAALLELAAELTTSVALMPCDISKAERGYRLLEPERFELDLSVADLEADMALDDAYAALAWQLLGNSQRLAEQYRHSGHWRSLQDWVQNLIELRAITASLGQAAPARLPVTCARAWMPCSKTGVHWCKPATMTKTSAAPRPSSSQKSWMILAGASSPWKPHVGCCRVPGLPNARAVASARARRFWQAGLHT